MNSLIEAIKTKDVKQIKRILAQGTKFGKGDDSDPSPLETAIETKNLSIVKVLIEYSSFENKRVWKNSNVLHHAVKQGNLDIVQYLLELYPEISINDTDSVSRTHLHIAIESNHPHIVRYLLQKGANVNAYRTTHKEINYFVTKERKQTALHLASSLGSLEIVNMLLEYNAEVNVFDFKEQSPLQKAIIHGHGEVAKVLIRAGSDINHKDMHYGHAALFYAVDKVLIDVVEDLIQFGADIIQYEALMHAASFRDSLEIVKILHRVGASLTVEDCEDIPLRLACCFSSFTIAEYMLKSGVSPNTINKSNRRTPLGNCCSYIKDPDLLKKFLELLLWYNASLEPSVGGDSPFLCAVRSRNFKAACILVKYGFDIKYVYEPWLKNSFTIIRVYNNEFNSTSLYFGERKDLNDLIKLLICAGFNFKTLQTFNDANRNIREYVVYSMNRPRSLKDFCRIKIRNLLGKRPMTTLYKLPLPKCLHDFLALDIL